jgi:hypothetical protein
MVPDPRIYAWREAHVSSSDLDCDPCHVFAFNTADNWAADISEDVAREIRHRADNANEHLSSSIEDFVVRHASRERLVLRLA